MDPGRNFLPLLFVLSGSFNTILIKWSNTLEGQCSDGEWRQFQHPVAQTALMFFSQFLCFVIYKIYSCFHNRRENDSLTSGNLEFSPLAFLLPAFLDAVASLLLFTGLYLTYASSFQMIKVAALIFAGIYGSIYLNQALITRHWMAFFTIACGIVSIVSIDLQRVHYDSVSLPPNADENSVMTGNLLILVAQIFHAAQFIYEEKLLKSTDIPALQATGWQGIFGMAITAITAVCMNFLPVSAAPFGENSHGVFDYIGDIFSQLASNPLLYVPLGLFVISHACYRFASLSIVKFSSTANRLIADNLCIICVWLAALLLNWEILNLITFMGCIILQMGVIAYRNAIFFDWYRSLLARLSRGRYADLSADTEDNRQPRIQAADVI